MIYEALDNLDTLSGMMDEDEYNEAIRMGIKSLEVVIDIMDILLDPDVRGLEDELICRKLLQYGFFKLEDGRYSINYDNHRA